MPRSRRHRDCSRWYRSPEVGGILRLPSRTVAAERRVCADNRLVCILQLRARCNAAGVQIVSSVALERIATGGPPWGVLLRRRGRTAWLLRNGEAGDEPMAHCMRQTVVALRLAGLAGASDRELEATYYLGLMMSVYCHADAAEQSKWFGDEISLKGDGFEMLDMSTARMVFFILRRVGSHGSGMARARRLAAFPVAGPKQMAAFTTTP